MAKVNKQVGNSPLRAIGKELGIVGATPIDSFKFTSSTGDTDIRNEAISSGIPSFLKRQVSLNEQDLQKEIAARLRTSGPSTFRNLRDILGTEGLANIQEQFGLTNIPQSVLPPDSVKNSKGFIATSGNALDGTLGGVRKSLEESLTPEGSIRNKLLRKQTTEQLSAPIEQELEARRIAQAEGEREPGLLQRIAGVGTNFLERLFNQTQEPPARSTVGDFIIPETGETVNFENEDVDVQIAQLEQEAQLAISQGRNPELVSRRLQEMISQLQARRGQ